MQTESKVAFLSATFILALSLIQLSIKDVGAEQKSTVSKIEIEVNEVAHPEQEGIEVYFAEGQSQITKLTQQEIVRNYVELQKTGRPIRAKVFSWGDRTLNKNRDLKLVENRNDKIESYLEEIDLHMPVRKFNLLESEDILFRSLNDKEKEILRKMINRKNHKSRSLVYLEAE